MTNANQREQNFFQLCQNLALLQQRHHLTCRQMAGILQISERAMKAVLQGTASSLPMDCFLRACLAFHVSPDQLFSLEKTEISFIEPQR